MKWPRHSPIQRLGVIGKGMITLALVFLLSSCVMATAAPAQDSFSEGELAQMLAPIALYPDALLSQILMASTYPLEVVEAARWSEKNLHLEGTEAVDAVADQDWDPSVKALVAFPRVLAQMNEDLTWTRNLGDAFLFQEADVADMIQELRQQAYDAGHLDDQENIRVVREREVIIIEPIHPRVVYVPYYRPTVVYGGWRWPAYGPVCWYPPHHYNLGFGITWIGGIPISHGFFFSAFHWPDRYVVITHFSDRYRHVDRPRPHRWSHDPRHRRGVAYRHPAVKTHYTRPLSPVPRKVIRPGAGSRFSPGPTSVRQDRRTMVQRPRHKDTGVWAVPTTVRIPIQRSPVPSARSVDRSRPGQNVDAARESVGVRHPDAAVRRDTRPAATRPSENTYSKRAPDITPVEQPKQTRRAGLRNPDQDAGRTDLSRAGRERPSKRVGDSTGNVQGRASFTGGPQAGHGRGMGLRDGQGASFR